MKKSLVALIAIILTCLVVYVGFNQHNIQIAYHRYEMQRNYDATFAADEDLGGGFRGYTLDDSYAAYEHHRDRLVELGQLDANRYTLQHLVPGTEERRCFWRLICLGECPDKIDAVGEREETGKPWTVTVWCWPEDTVSWDGYISTRDTARYAADFMADETDNMGTK